MKKILLLLLISLQSSAVFEHDRAVYAGQKGDWKKSCQLMAQQIAQNPDNPLVLYDAGVSAFNTKQYNAALAYFSASAQSDQVDSKLKEQAHFNSGNTLVKLNKLENALDEYQKVLAINPDNVHAKHNYEQVKKMLEQKKEEEQKDTEKDNKDKEQEKNNKKEKDNQKKDQDKNKQSSDQQKSQENNQKDDTQEQDSKDSGEQKNNQQSQGKDTQDENKNDASQDEHQHKQEQTQACDATSEQDQEKESLLEEQKIDPVIAQLLKEQESKDAQTQKKHARVQCMQKKGMGDDRYCW